MSGWTNVGKQRALDLLRGASLPTNYYIALLADSSVLGPDVAAMSDVVEITSGNGYSSGGQSIEPNGTDFDFLDAALSGDEVNLRIKDIVWTATGGPIPNGGNDARYAVLTDDNATVADREIWYYWDLQESYGVSNTQSLTLVDTEITLYTAS